MITPKQASIDSLKRTFSVDIATEIDRIKEDMHIDKHGYPAFWSLIRPGFNKDKINPDINCPMNCLLDFKPERQKKVHARGIPLKQFLLPEKDETDIKLCRDVEALINKYNIEIYGKNLESSLYKKESYYLLLTDFEELLEEIHKLTLGKKYMGLFLWLLNKAFSEDAENELNSEKFQNQLQTNRTLVLKVLYDVNKEALLECFSRNMK